ncbi:MAG TPA: hypothetical protein VGM64_10475 [Lacunisphaera sp.]|jgi:hypothetical protein
MPFVLTPSFRISISLLGVTGTVRAEVMNMMPVIRRQAVRAVQDAKARGRMK